MSGRYSEKPFKQNKNAIIFLILFTDATFDGRVGFFLFGSIFIVKLISEMDEKRIRQIVKEAIVKQFDLFGEPEVKKIRKSRPKMSDELQKKIKNEKEFERKWAEKGVYQGYLFGQLPTN